MALILRLDVDKPYGHHTLIRRVASKIVENSIIPPPQIGYLSHLTTTLEILDQYQIKAILYFRRCSVPTPSSLEAIRKSGHQIGWHAENTMSIESLRDELEFAKTKLGNLHSFSKHGSGEKKLGYHHYFPYEPEKYIHWSKTLGVKFPFGNGVAKKKPDQMNDFFPDMFWIEKNYRSDEYNSIQKLVEDSKQSDIVVISHPENIVTSKQCRDDLVSICKLARQMNVKWINN